MAATIVIAGAIAAYTIWVIRKKRKEMKAGNYCGCGCSGCASQKKCKK